MGLCQLRRRRRNNRRRTGLRKERRSGQRIQEATIVVPAKAGTHNEKPFSPLKIRCLHPESIPGMSVRSSIRWFDSMRSKRMHTPIPYVSNSGKLSGSTLCFWTAYPEQICASLTSTVYSRIRKIVGKRHSFSYARRCRETLFSAAAYYATTRDDWFFDRFLGILKKKRRRFAHNLTVYALSTLDDDKRFVISQICDQILWLSFRSRGPCDPQRRDKSFYDCVSDPLSSFELMESETRRISSLKQASQGWRTTNRANVAKHTSSVDARSSDESVVSASSVGTPMSILSDELEWD